MCDCGARVPDSRCERATLSETREIRNKITLGPSKRSPTINRHQFPTRICRQEIEVPARQSRSSSPAQQCSFRKSDAQQDGDSSRERSAGRGRRELVLQAHDHATPDTPSFTSMLHLKLRRTDRLPTAGIGSTKRW